MKISKEDFKVIYTRGSGPGGQHRNKVETVCEITHIPTGLKQRCSASRSKLTNYETAMKMLLTKLKHIEEQKKHNDLNKIRAEAVFDDSNGSKVIRTYNYQRHEVKNHLNGKKANLKQVLDGDLELVQ